MLFDWHLNQSSCRYFASLPDLTKLPGKREMEGEVLFLVCSQVGVAVGTGVVHVHALLHTARDETAPTNTPY